MNLSKREQVVFTLTLVILGLLIGDRLVLSPTLERRDDLDSERQRLVGELKQADLVFRKSRLLRETWGAMLESGLHATASAAESEALNAIRQWSQTSGLSLVALRPEVADVGSRLRAVEIQATGNGSMQAAARFVHMAETSELPIRVTEMQLGARQQAADDLTLQLRLSMLYMDQNDQDDTSPDRRTQR